MQDCFCNECNNCSEELKKKKKMIAQGVLSSDYMTSSGSVSSGMSADSFHHNKMK